jgi:hypothetical protein
MAAAIWSASFCGTRGSFVVVTRRKDRLQLGRPG